MADRGFCSFAHLAMLPAASMDAVFRLHQRQIVDFAPGRPHRGKSAKGHRHDAAGPDREPQARRQELSAREEKADEGV